MCIAVYKPAGVTIPDATLRRCWDRNPHGAGIAYPTGNGRVAVRKTLHRGEFTKLWKRVPEDRDVVVHFRYATHGRVGMRNTHPFTVSPGLVVAHNGVIHETAPDANDFRSDTRLFVDRVLTPAWRLWGTDGFEDRLYESATFQDWLTDRIGTSKLVFLNRDGHVAIIGEHRGEWAGGVWYSNRGFRAPARRKKKRPTRRKSKTRLAPQRVFFDTDHDPYAADEKAERLEQLRAEANRILEARPEPKDWSDTDYYILAEAYR